MWHHVKMNQWMISWVTTLTFLVTFTFPDVERRCFTGSLPWHRTSLAAVLPLISSTDLTNLQHLTRGVVHQTRRGLQREVVTAWLPTCAEETFVFQIKKNPLVFCLWLRVLILKTIQELDFILPWFEVVRIEDSIVAKMKIWACC